jgi:PiT family inorganic phosphate transporter
VLYVTAFLMKAPISTTQTITAAILGAGATRRASAVRWQVARSIGTAWLLTFPGAGVPAAALYLILHGLTSL